MHFRCLLFKKSDKIHYLMTWCEWDCHQKSNYKQKETNKSNYKEDHQFRRSRGKGSYRFITMMAILVFLDIFVLKIFSPCCLHFSWMTIVLEWGFGKMFTLMTRMTIEIEKNYSLNYLHDYLLQLFHLANMFSKLHYSHHVLSLYFRSSLRRKKPDHVLKNDLLSQLLCLVFFICLQFWIEAGTFIMLRCKVLDRRE